MVYMALSNFVTIEASFTCIPYHCTRQDYLVASCSYHTIACIRAFLLAQLLPREAVCTASSQCRVQLQCRWIQAAAVRLIEPTYCI